MKNELSLSVRIKSAKEITMGLILNKKRIDWRQEAQFKKKNGLFKNKLNLSVRIGAKKEIRMGFI